MGIFKFLKKKAEIPGTPIPVVEPLPLQFDITDFSMTKIPVVSEPELLKPEIVAAITVAIQLSLSEANLQENRQPLLRRQANTAWKITGIQRVMQVRQ